MLAVFGVVAFWIPGVYVFARHGEAVSSAAEALLGVGAIASISSHLVGIGVVFAAPRGKRVAGVLANAIPLVILAALMALGTTVPGQRMTCATCGTELATANVLYDPSGNVTCAGACWRAKPPPGTCEHP